MEKLFAKLKEYLHMDTEIPYEEFSEYYQELINLLNSSFNDMDRESCITARYTCSIVQSNADERAKGHKGTAKAYKKMAAKCGFWVDAINFRLLKEGMSQSEIDQATAEINDNIE